MSTLSLFRTIFEQNNTVDFEPFELKHFLKDKSKYKLLEALVRIKVGKG